MAEVQSPAELLQVAKNQGAASALREEVLQGNRLEPACPGTWLVVQQAPEGRGGLAGRGMAGRRTQLGWEAGAQAGPRAPVGDLPEELPWDQQGACCRTEEGGRDPCRFLGRLVACRSRQGRWERLLEACLQGPSEGRRLEEQRQLPGQRQERQRVRLERRRVRTCDKQLEGFAALEQCCASFPLRPAYAQPRHHGARPCRLFCRHTQR